MAGDLRVFTLTIAHKVQRSCKSLVRGSKECRLAHVATLAVPQPGHALVHEGCLDLVVAKQSLEQWQLPDAAVRRIPDEKMQVTL